MPEPSSAATLRDVYDLVDRTRQETTGQISQLSQKLDDFARSNEHRMTIVEQHQATQAQQLTEVVSRLDKHSQDIGTLKDQQRLDEAAAKEKSSAWSKRSSLVAIITSVILATGTIITVILSIK
jgi:hypothetical protein